MRPDPELVKKLAEFGTATIHEAAGQIGALPGRIKPISQTMKLSGVVYPLHCLARSNINLHEAIYKAQPGDILVASVEDLGEAGFWGDILTAAAQEKGLKGLVIDGCVRDADDIDALGFAVFSSGLNILGTGKKRGGTVGQSIVIGDVEINAGDVIVGDRDGLVVIPADRLEEVIEASQAREDKEQDVRNRLKAGETSLNIYKFP
ncbi:MAG: 4-hydroxy-4-methyl-2-oxoglutarate aldolase [Kordiimonadaceae bacterium]|jgi:4-hydroxy-4-methyl-2-oxoglutarate aldolase|nr:4-hydroxy-4-methyl-2-oxoglutarate aldolase [Kordiimonadaceae bacterium]MBT6035329.1 4-hydroxy-4-methyl-2-oxoglutarate aldolase [Kordiimonadaceae bacterium]MBT6328490.1 4-hydroxy-4-methyl-2-oxoglutarate aldolase [Kordiimonadaceae bacterium]MBT7581346.1 4-hydroxy-4-methyl-2-oxoglutarate aldolase [Kordiimonadaceae bacterium]